MTEVAFHFNVPDRLAYTCRLVRKAGEPMRSTMDAASATVFTMFASGGANGSMQ